MILPKLPVSPIAKMRREKALKLINDNVEVLHREYFGRGLTDDEMIHKIIELENRLARIRAGIRRTR